MEGYSQLLSESELVDTNSTSSHTRARSNEVRTKMKDLRVLLTHPTPELYPKKIIGTHQHY